MPRNEKDNGKIWNSGRNNVTVERWWNGNGTEEEKGIKERVEKKQKEEWKKEVEEIERRILLEM